tara:strand:- start:32 stop:352 length:321 start_codon:yes stop_codon:yes gene_type:complete
MANLNDKTKEVLDSLYTALNSFGFRFYSAKSNKGINVKAIMSPSQVSEIEQIIDENSDILVSWAVIPGEGGFHPKTGKALAKNTYIGYAKDTSISDASDLYDLELS